MRIYLDQCVYAGLLSGDIKKEEFLAEDDEVCFSGAHAEEICLKQEKDITVDDMNQTNSLIDLIDDIQVYSLRWNDLDKITFYSENFQDSIQRVLDYEDTKNLVKDTGELSFYLSREANDDLQKKNKHHTNIGQETHITIWNNLSVFNNNKNIILNLRDKYKNKNKDEINFSDLQSTITRLISILRLSGYKREKNVQKSESSVHDITHACYAAYCDKFITRDKRLFHLVKAIFYLIGIKVEIILL